MALPKLTYGKVWTNETDFPTYQSDEAQVRADLQYHPDAVRDYINDALLAWLQSRLAAEDLGASDDSGAASNVQSVLDAHKEGMAQLKADLETLATGGVPSVVMTTPVNFTEASWVNTSDGVSLTIAKSEHKRENANFGYSIYQLVNRVYRGGTWGVAATRVAYNADGSITLTADEAYSGKIVFFGV